MRIFRLVYYHCLAYYRFTATELLLLLLYCCRHISTHAAIITGCFTAFVIVARHCCHIHMFFSPTASCYQYAARHQFAAQPAYHQSSLIITTLKVKTLSRHHRFCRIILWLPILHVNISSCLSFATPHHCFHCNLAATLLLLRTISH